MCAFVFKYYSSCTSSLQVTQTDKDGRNVKLYSSSHKILWIKNNKTQIA